MNSSEANIVKKLKPKVKKYRLASKVADNLGITVQTVYNVMNGKYYQADVVDAMIEAVEMVEKRIKIQQERVNQLQ